MDVIAILPACDGQADAVSAYTVKLKDDPSAQHSSLCMSNGYVFSKCCWDLDGRKYHIGVCLFIENRDYSYRYTWMTLKNGCGKKQNMAPMWKKWMTKADLDKPTWDVLNVNVNRMKLLLKSFQMCLNHLFLLEQLKNFRVGQTYQQERSPLKNEDPPYDTNTFVTQPYNSLSYHLLQFPFLSKNKKKN